MSERKFIGAILLLGSLFGLSKTVKDANSNLPAPPIPRRKPIYLGDNGQDTLDALYKKHGNEKGVDWRLLKAIARVESNENPSAKNPLDPSYGLMQVLCRNDGSQTGHCKNNLNVVDWDQANPDKLYDPDFNIHIAAQILRWNTGQYGTLKGIATYNNFSARFDPDDGPFRNQNYVNKVLREYAALGGRVPGGI